MLYQKWENGFGFMFYIIIVFSEENDSTIIVRKL